MFFLTVVLKKRISKIKKLRRRVVQNFFGPASARYKKYAPLLREKRLKGIVYFAEKNGLGPEFARIGDFGRIFPNMRKLFSVKQVGAPFLDALTMAGGVSVGDVLRNANGLEFAKALTVGIGNRSDNRRGFGSAIGHALKIGGAKDFCSAMKIAGGLNVGQATVYGLSGGFGKVLNIVGGQKVGEALKIVGGMTFGRVLRASDSAKLGRDLKFSFYPTISRIASGHYK